MPEPRQSDIEAVANDALDLDAALRPPPAGQPRPSEAVKFALESLGNAIVNRIHEAGNDAQQYFGDVKRLLRAVEIVGRVSTLDSDDEDDSDGIGAFRAMHPYRARNRRRGGGADNANLVEIGDGPIGANPMDNMVGQMVDALVQHAPALQGAVRGAMPPTMIEGRANQDRRFALMDEFHAIRGLLNTPGIPDDQRDGLLARANHIMERLRADSERADSGDAVGKDQNDRNENGNKEENNGDDYNDAT